MERTHRFRELFSKAQEKMGNLTIWGKLCLLVDVSWEKLRYGTAREDYFQYEFYKKNNRGRREFITHGKSAKIHAICNDPEKATIFSDKASFAQIFKDYIGRDILDMKNTTLEEFRDFTVKHDKMFVKPQDGSYGRGVSIVRCNAENAEDLYKDYNGKKILIEEVITQHPAMARFNSSSLNSVRIVTLIKANGEPVVLPGSVVRIGREGKIADNFHHNGMGAQIDNSTGLICSVGIDKNGNKYIVHPDSKLTLLGFCIPLWDEIKRCVCAAAKLVPEVRYVGWDVAITNDNRVVLIEGNDRADPDLGQMSDSIGKWSTFKAYLDEIKALQ